MNEDSPNDNSKPIIFPNMARNYTIIKTYYLQDIDDYRMANYIPVGLEFVNISSASCKEYYTRLSENSTGMNAWYALLDTVLGYLYKDNKVKFNAHVVDLNNRSNSKYRIYHKDDLDGVDCESECLYNITNSDYYVYHKEMNPQEILSIIDKLASQCGYSKFRVPLKPI